MPEPAIQSEEPAFHNSELTNLKQSSAMEIAKVLNSSSPEAASAVGVQHPVESKVRHVYVLARPIKVAGVFSVLSHGKFPLCHWGVLLSELEDLATMWCCFPGDGQPRPRPENVHGMETTPKVWGSLFELYRDPTTNQNKPHVVYNFGHSELHREWQFLALFKVGTAKIRDDELYEKGESHYFSPTL